MTPAKKNVNFDQDNDDSFDFISPAVKLNYQPDTIRHQTNEPNFTNDSNENIVNDQNQIQNMFKEYIASKVAFDKNEALIKTQNSKDSKNYNSLNDSSIDVSSNSGPQAFPVVWQGPKPSLLGFMNLFETKVKETN
jgi:hypothetical protein